MATTSTNYLDMSDEDMLKAGPPSAEAVAAAEVEVKEEVKEDLVDEVDDDKVDEVDPKATEVKAEDADDEDGDKPAEEEGDDADDLVKEDPVKEVKEPVKADAKTAVKEPVKEEKVEAEAVDYKAAYEKLLAPFKANGRDIQVQSVDEALTLMQMGANYNKKMAGLKPNLKLMKLLENNGLLDESKLSFLIELDKKSPDAINKLVKDSGLNPMDFDAEKAGEYQPKIHTVDDREMDMDTVLEDISSTPAYTRTLTIVSKEWDGASKQVIAGQPQLLRVINDHVTSGIYDLISTEVERERVLGRLKGLNDIDAYRQVGDSIQARGGFDHLGSSRKETKTPAVIVTPKPKVAESAELKDKRRAASSSKAAVTGSKIPEGFNPLGLDDAEFSKLSADMFRK